jgi:glycosyltransferase involved in cell wall biosynthesis
MSVPLGVLLVTDAFPPVCGGSGWSTWELARGLSARGHHVEVVKVDTSAREDRIHNGRYESVPVTTFARAVTDVPVARNFVKNEQLWSELSASVLSPKLATGAFDVVHGQHVLSAVPAIRAGEAAGVPAVATVRDYWPVCYWSDLIIDPASPHLCPACTVRNMSKCVLPRAGAASIAAWPIIPYMRANLRTKRSTLARAGAIIAVSAAIATDLRRRASELAESPVFTIPNPVDLTALDFAVTSAPPADGPYVLYAGKLAPNKGVQFLIDAVANAGITWPLVVAGDGPLRGQLEGEARERGVDLRVLGWIDRTEVWTWMRHATMLAFPSFGPESLSRVLIEAAALGVPIAAMDTGGTRDVIHAGITGLLSADAAGLSRDLARLAGDDRLRAAIGAAARTDVRQRFSAASVVERVEQVYRGLIRPRAA